ncbi:hypothetical protein [Porcipelethomonas sp.]|uniref:hypothetical protein n=1 Tax=Porcipelethomonas sp. TaxID=2981675 RepID=UPI003EF1CD6F
MQDKKDKNKEQSIFETVRTVNEKEKQKAEEDRIKQEKAEEIQREKYEHKLAEDKVEILKLKQGVIENSDKLDLSAEEKKKYTVWQKFKNFIYHNKWWLGITTFFVLVAAFLVYDKVTTVKSDMKVMLISNDADLYMHIEDMVDFFGSYIDDYNDDGEKCVDIIYIPISDDESENTKSLNAYDSNLSQLSTEFQLGETMMIVGDSKSDDLVQPEDSLVNLEELFPDCPEVEDYKYYLKDTDFAKLIGYDENTIPDDLYIGVRKPTSTLNSDKTTQENYDIALEAIEKIIDDLSK